MRRMAMGVAFVATVTSCSMFTTQQGGKAVVAGIDVALCVLAHSTEPIPQIIATCGAENEQQVLNIFAAAQRANRRGFSVRPPDDADAGR